MGITLENERWAARWNPSNYKLNLRENHSSPRYSHIRLTIPEVMSITLQKHNSRTQITIDIKKNQMKEEKEKNKKSVCGFNSGIKIIKKGITPINYL